MAALAVTVRRARRVAQVFREVSGQTGSLRAASLYTLRYTISKLPRLLVRFRGFGLRRRQARAEIARVRASAATDTPIVAIAVSGGLGDYLVIARFVRDLTETCGPLNCDIFASDTGHARWVFGAIGGIRSCREDMLFDDCLGEYDLALRASQAVTIATPLDRWGGLARRSALATAAARIWRAYQDVAPFVERHPRWDNFLAQTAVFANRTRNDFLHGMAGIGYGGDRLPIAVDDVAFVQHGLRHAGYVTLHNGFDPRFFTQNDRATKCYPHFGEVARLLKQRWPGLTIVQLGTRTSERVADADLNLIGATTLPQAAGLIAHARLHIDNEGGLVHLARCLGVTCCVVFGPTPASYFGYAGNINIEPTFCGGCWWMTETWMDTCPRGFAAPRCMSEQDPRVVASSIVRFLAAEPGRLRGSAAVLAAD